MRGVSASFIVIIDVFCGICSSYVCVQIVMTYLHYTFSSYSQYCHLSIEMRHCTLEIIVFFCPLADLCVCGCVYMIYSTCHARIEFRHILIKHSSEQTPEHVYLANGENSCVGSYWWMHVKWASIRVGPMNKFILPAYNDMPKPMCFLNKKNWLFLFAWRKSVHGHRIQLILLVRYFPSRSALGYPEKTQ